ncbi:MAG: hypothetical protein NVSMB45_17130 [Ginsengibacter sp.]
MQSIWELIKDYYSKIGMKYNVNPVIFVGIHVIATPLFILSVSWLISRYYKKKDIFFPAIITVFIFNAANIYLVIFGKNIPWYIYSILAFTTLASGYFSYLKIKKRIHQ